MINDSLNFRTLDFCCCWRIHHVAMFFTLIFLAQLISYFSERMTHFRRLLVNLLVAFLLSAVPIVHAITTENSQKCTVNSPHYCPIGGSCCCPEKTMCTPLSAAGYQCCDFKMVNGTAKACTENYQCAACWFITAYDVYLLRYSVWFQASKKKTRFAVVGVLCCHYNRNCRTQRGR